MKWKKKLRHKYYEYCDVNPHKYDAIAMAMKWSWSPMRWGIIVFDYQELMTSVEALCTLLLAEKPESLISRLLETYIQEEADDLEFFELGQTFKSLRVQEDVIKNILANNSSGNNLEILRGYQS